MTRFQHYGHMGAEYPALLKWCRELMAWDELAKTSTARDAALVFWEDTDALDKWIATGYSLMLTAQFNMDAANELLHFSKGGDIALMGIEQILHRRGLYYHQRSDNDDDGYNESHALSAVWDMTVGSAMVRAKEDFQEDCALHREWLTCGLSLFWQEKEAEPFEDDSTCIHLVDESHVQWLQQQSQKQAWVQETVALYVLDNNDLPMWNWCFTERLGENPSLDFVESLLILMDEHLENPKGPMVLFSHKAPALYQHIVDAMQLHDNLFNEADDTRAQVVHGMLHTRPQNKLGIEMDAAVCDKLFLDNP